MVTSRSPPTTWRPIAEATHTPQDGDGVDAGAPWRPRHRQMYMYTCASSESCTISLFNLDRMVETLRDLVSSGSGQQSFP